MSAASTRWAVRFFRRVRRTQVRRNPCSAPATCASSIQSSVRLAIASKILAVASQSRVADESPTWWFAKPLQLDRVYRPKPTFIEIEFTLALLYSMARRAAETCSAAPTHACDPPAYSSSRSTTADFSRDMPRKLETPAYGEREAQLVSANSRLATTSHPMTVKSTSSGP